VWSGRTKAAVADTSPERADRLRAKARRQLDAVSRRAAAAAQAQNPRRRISAACRDAIQVLVAERQDLVGGSPGGAFLDPQTALLH
jgi:hypothetical protein